VDTHKRLAPSGFCGWCNREANYRVGRGTDLKVRNRNEVAPPEKHNRTRRGGGLHLDHHLKFFGLRHTIRYYLVRAAAERSPISIRAATSGHAAAVPPSAASNSRRPMVTVIRPSRARCVKATIPRHQRAVLTAPGGPRLGSVNVRFAPKATEVLHCRELTRWETGLLQFAEW
jgi:hypothetical protein